MLALEKIRKTSSTLAAALQAVLGDRPLHAKRFLWCCGINTDQLVINLVGELEALKTQFTDKDRGSVGTGGYDGIAVTTVTSCDIYADRVLNLLQRIRGIKIQELLLDANTRSLVRRLSTKAERRIDERHRCLSVLKLWVKTEVLCDQVGDIIESKKEVDGNFAAIIGDQVKSFGDLLKWFDRFCSASTSKVMWSRRLHALRGEVEMAARDLERLSGGADAGKKEAKRLLTITNQSLVAFSAPPEITVDSKIGILLAQQTIFRDMSRIAEKYRRVFLIGCSSGVKIGKIMIEEMIKRTQEFSNFLREHGERIWMGYANYMLETKGAEVSAREIVGKVAELLGGLNQQIELLQRFLIGGGITIQVGLNLPAAIPLDEVVAGVTDFLQIYAAEVFDQVASTEPVIAMAGAVVNDVATDRSAASDVNATPDEASDVTVVDPKVVGIDEVAVAPSSEATSTRLEYVAAVVKAAATPAVHVGFFSAPSVDLTEEQKVGLDDFMKRVATVPKAGEFFTDSQLTVAHRFLTNIMKRNVRNANMVVFWLAEKLSVSPSWIEDNGFKAELESLLRPAVITPYNPNP